MRSFWALQMNVAVPWRLLAYVGALALLAILGIHLRDRLPVVEAIEPAAKPGWSGASRSHPAFCGQPVQFA
jgi:hypothetical protein